MEEKLRILIVEDEGIQAMALEEVLERNGYDIVAIVDHGSEAIAVIEKQDVDLLILDVNIKGSWDGIETAIRIQDIKKIPFIYLTAYMDSATHERAEKTGPLAYINKPYQEARLLTTIGKVLKVQ